MMGAKPERMLTMPEVQQYIRFSETHIYRLMKRKRFPPQVRQGDNRVAWREGDILAYQKGKRDWDAVPDGDAVPLKKAA